MLLKKLGLFATLGISSILVACGPDCTSTCEDGQESGDCFQDLEGNNFDCENFCEAVETLVSEDNADCEDDLDAVIDCANEDDDVCNGYNDCDDEVEDLGACIAEYCLDEPNSDECEDYFDAID